MERTITVKGIGEVTAKSDYIVLSMELESRDKEYGTAMEMETEKLNELNTVLVSIGFEKKALKTVDFQVETEYENQKDELGNYKKVFAGYACRHQLKLSFDFDLKKLSQVLTAIADCQGHPELGISFTVKNPSAVNEALLRKAAENAREKAEILCTASDVKMGNLLTIEYNWTSLSLYSETRFALPKGYTRNAASTMALGTDMEPDDIRIKDTAVFVWEIV